MTRKGCGIYLRFPLGLGMNGLTVWAWEGSEGKSIKLVSAFTLQNPRVSFLRLPWRRHPKSRCWPGHAPSMASKGWFFLHLPASGSWGVPWHGSIISASSHGVFPLCLKSLCPHLAFSLRVWFQFPSSFPFPQRTPVTLDWSSPWLSYLDLMTSAKTLFQNKLTFTGMGFKTSEYLFGEDSTEPTTVQLVTKLSLCVLTSAPICTQWHLVACVNRFNISFSFHLILPLVLSGCSLKH